MSEVLSLVELLGQYRNRKIEFTHEAPCEIEINGSEIKQVVLNLVTNALESMEAGQTLRISLTDLTDQVYITLEDEGCGMTPEVIENLFEPFFTRRKNGRGTGLGLSISNRIITDHGGRIEVASEGPGQGSTFVVHLPRVAVRSESSRLGSTRGRGEGGTRGKTYESESPHLPLSASPPLVIWGRFRNEKDRFLSNDTTQQEDRLPDFFDFAMTRRH